jgi:hypothetical protein
MGNAICLECGKPSHVFHHIVPKSLGGTRTVPLCYRCHSLIHSITAVNISALVKAGIAKAIANGKHIGKPRKYDNFQVDKIINLLNELKSIRAVGRNLGIPESSIRRIMKRRANENSKEVKHQRC